jgi:hypothetical protein
MTKYKDVTKIKGFSGAKVELLTYPDGKRVVRKSATGKYRKKLLHEIKWYQNLDEITQGIFPKIESIKITNGSAEFIMPFYYDGNIFEKCYIKREDSIKIIVSFFTALTFKLYLPTLSKNNGSIFIEVFLQEKLFKRMNKIKYIDFSSNIIINGKNLKSLKSLLKTLTNSGFFVFMKENTKLCKTHGDLTLRNILVDPKNDNDFMFIDVNPKNFMAGYLSDPIEDVSRIIAYMYPVLPIKNNSIYWEQDGENYILHELDVVSTKYKKDVSKLLSDSSFKNLMGKIYADKVLLKNRINFFSIIHVLTIAMSRLIDGDEKIGFGLYLWGHNALSGFIDKNKAL